MKLELISFSLCPYVQRSVITLKHKKADFSVTLIDLDNPPEWFTAISPLGQVPVLRVKDAPGAKAEHVIFESAVINELIDETIGKPLHPSDPYQKATERAWIEFGTGLLGTNYQMTLAETGQELLEAKEEFFDDLARLESVVNPQGPYFRGAEFSLVDAAYAPLFMRIFLSETLNKDPSWSSMPKVKAWGEALMRVPAVQESVDPDFAQAYRKFCKEAGSLIF